MMSAVDGCSEGGTTGSNNVFNGAEDGPWVVLSQVCRRLSPPSLLH